ncbi:MAG: methylenetetrahydrofolate reductase [Pseudonocardiaceae bacterium]|nr:methylenetetrahydrofolate reductase [Pseudonocardiaceae bacterium]
MTIDRNVHDTRRWGVRNQPASAGHAAGKPVPTDPRFSSRLLYLLHRFLQPNRFYRVLAAWLERHGWAYRIFTKAEEKAKSDIFNCQMCGQCALPATGYACPMSCPKQLRNGPCGGVAANGDCEVYPGITCVWLIAFERAEREGHEDDLALLQRPVDHRQRGRSSWVNYWLGRDDELWTATDGLDGRERPVQGGARRDDKVAA